VPAYEFVPTVIIAANSLPVVSFSLEFKNKQNKVN